ncbi:MAG: hypothetical protein EXS46_03570 [Candidatus Taylorbacteria bacterium]|nr:hypothetical protein [Candidatus Taylorbacteria bacterium]
MKTSVSVSVLILFMCCGLSLHAEEHLKTNSGSADKFLMAKATGGVPVSIRPGFGGFVGKKASIPFFEKEDLKLSLGAVVDKKEKAKVPNVDDTPPDIKVLEKETFPNLYYVHTDENPNREMSQNDVGRIWRMSRKTTLLFPFGRWDNPGIKERVMLGFCLTWKL